MDDFARLSAGEREEVFKETAAKKGIAWHLIEKDFWVCWSLRRVFGLSELRERLIFKGGTSLSKVYNVIERFSEDVDLSLNREAYGFVEDQSPYSATRRE